jgi:hypothetical protein
MGTKFTKLLKKYQIAIKIPKIFHSKAFYNFPKIYISGMKIYHLAGVNFSSPFFRGKSLSAEFPTIVK